MTVSQTTVQRGQTFTVSQQIHNPEQFTVTNAKPTIYGQQAAIVDIAELVSCTGAVAPCSAYFSSYRAPVGDLAAGDSRTVEFTLRVREDAPVGQFTLQHQFVGDNYSFSVLDGPVMTVVEAPGHADIGVALDASPRHLLTSKVNYAITVTNAGPADATDVRVSATYAAGLRFTRSADCARVADTRTVTCDIPALAAGASRTVTFSTATGLLAIGTFSTTVNRTQSSPTDPNPANDSAVKRCTALTGLLVTC